ncbi:MAG TPA: hypothetical protein VE571_02550, partial [Solirubrobacteraceae bacterium]|nr:hypothetical protein [Solirubrobacteraceae bacterium]
MGIWTTEAQTVGRPEEVMLLLTEPGAIRRWAPIPFEVVDLHGERLTSGGTARVRGGLIGRTLE